ncbi:kinase-like domain-containing protein, partial [Gorgonomyces haynaldii]
MVEQIDLVAEEGQEIGRGGFGIVRKHSWNDITVAVKWFPKTITIDNIKNEVGALARLNHENVINIEAIAMDNGSIGLVMPFMQSDLFRFLHVQGNAELLTGDEKNVLSIGITKGVQFIHQNGIIHRDLKSLNVLLDEHRTPKICDFGMAKTKSMTKGSFRGGTMAYLSPELLSRKAPHSIQSDVYALGLILFEIYSG